MLLDWWPCSSFPLRRRDGPFQLGNPVGPLNERRRWTWTRLKLINLNFPFLIGQEGITLGSRGLFFLLFAAKIDQRCRDRDELFFSRLSRSRLRRSIFATNNREKRASGTQDMKACGRCNGQRYKWRCKTHKPLVDSQRLGLSAAQAKIHPIR